MSMVAGKYKQRVLAGFLTSYLVILILPLIIGGLLHRETLKIVERDAKETNLSILEQSRDVIDKSLMEVDALAMQLAMNSEVTGWLNLNRELESRDINKIRNTSLNLKSYLVANSFIDTFYIYIKKPGIVLSPKASYINRDFFYGQSFTYAEMEETEWYEEILDRRHDKKFFPKQPVTIDGKERSMIAYVQSIPLADAGDIKGSVLAFVEENQFRKLLQRLYIGEYGWAYILDKSGRVIADVTGDEEGIDYSMDFLQENRGFTEYRTSGENITVSYTTSSYNGWKYVAAVPSNMVMAKARYIRKITMFFTAAILLLGCMAAAYMAYRKSKPIKELINVLKDNVGADVCRAHNEYEFLQGNISKILASNKDLQDTIERQLPILEAVFTERLLKGEFYKMEEIEASMEQIGKRIEGSRFLVLILYLEEEYTNFFSKEIIEEMSIKRIVIKEYLDKVIDIQHLLYNRDDDKIVILLGADFNSADAFLEYAGGLIEKVLDELWNSYRSHVFFTVGGVYNSLLDVFRSFEDAKSICIYRQRGSGDRAVWYDRVPKGNDIYSYTIEMELRLMNKVKSGSEEEVEKTFELLYEENFIKRKLSADMQRQLVTEIYGTVVKLLDEIRISEKEKLKDIEEKLRKFDSGKNMDKVFNYLMQSCLSISTIVNEQKKSYNARLVNSIMDYIGSAYMEKDICLFSVAEKFQVSETYLSHLFKEHSGENFFNYLENLRQKNARKLLEETGLSVDEIAKRSGYNSSDTFRKAFKRFFGVSPASFRNSAREKFMP